MGRVRLKRLCEAWAFQEPASGIGPILTKIWVTYDILNKLNAALSDESQEVRRIASVTVQRTFVYVDVSDFSKYKPGQQALIINWLVYIVAQEHWWALRGAFVLQAGDDEAASEVFHRFAKRLILLAGQRFDAHLRQKVDPEDIMQSVFRSFFAHQAARELVNLESWNSLWSMLVLMTVRKCRRQGRLYYADRRQRLALFGDWKEQHNHKAGKED